MIQIASENVRISCVYRDGKAQFEPSIDKLQQFKCLGYGACRTSDATALMLKTESGADVQTCATLQDGDHCVDYECTKYKSHIRNPARNKIRCEFQAWKEPSEDYCVFCPEGQHKVNQMTCEECAEGKYLKSGTTNDRVTCMNCERGKYRGDTQVTCTDCPIGRFQDTSGGSECKECASGQYQLDEGKPYCTKCPRGYECLKPKESGQPCPAGKFQNKTGQSKCEACTEGWYQVNEGQSRCNLCEAGSKCSKAELNPQRCPAGEFQNKTGQTQCEECPKGHYRVEKGQSDCIACTTSHRCATAIKRPQQCPAGKFQDETGQTTCEECPKGQYSERMRSECTRCAAGQYTQYTKSTACTDCEAGKYQDTETGTSCKICAAGKFSSGTAALTCDSCPAGKFQDSEGQTRCEECSEGKYQSNAGASSCNLCDWYSFCVETGIGEPSLSPFVFVVPGIFLISIPIIAKIVQLVIKAVTAWKPQSKADAARAKKFVLPKTSEAMAPSVSAFKDCEAHFVETDWTEDDMNIIQEHRARVVSYLGSRVQKAAEREQIRIMRCCINMDVLHDFKTLYDATMQNIRNKEPAGLKMYTETARKMQAAATKCPRNPSSLFDLYDSGRAAYHRFHAFVARAAEASDGAYVYTSHDRLPRMKGIYRVLEKGIFKYNRDWTQDLDLGQVRDLVRGGIIDTTMQGLQAVAEYIHKSSEVTVCRIKDRFNQPSGAGWTDLMINFYLNDDPGKHVCEVQLMHFKMYSQRTTQEGHGAYNIFRVSVSNPPPSSYCWHQKGVFLSLSLSLSLSQYSQSYRCCFATIYACSAVESIGCL